LKNKQLNETVAGKKIKESFAQEIMSLMCYKNIYIPYISSQKWVNALQKLFYSRDCFNKTAKSWWQFHGNLIIDINNKKLKIVLLLLFMIQNLSIWSLET